MEKKYKNQDKHMVKFYGFHIVSHFIFDMLTHRYDGCVPVQLIRSSLFSV